MTYLISNHIENVFIIHELIIILRTKIIKLLIPNLNKELSTSKYNNFQKIPHSKNKLIKEKLIKS